MVIPVEVIGLAAVVVLFILIVLMIVMGVKLRKLRKSYQAMLNGSSSMNIEEVLMDLQGRSKQLEQQSEKADQAISSIRQDLKKLKAHIGVMRYNAFGDSGSDLSFSVAIVDQELNGVVISGIHNREETYVYAKPLEQGRSKYTLSPEEREAVSRSLPKE
ncbi:DUF4446 family protein [Paenibacillus sp. YYML68]|uniref:DUF4446 family protein n=1 Tax=Paenibacillus sp. YYML68 TaxID=2909250 RepID=UPI002493A30A|nr:DUF4446 family protein [Paenibacillus sp. YYML68]